MDLSWFGKITAIKMKVLPQFMFIFQKLILPLSDGLLNKIQRICSRFIWAGRKPRIKVAIMQQKKTQGGVALPNIRFYYQAALLESILQWWNFVNKLSWQLEQEETEESLVVWIIIKQEFELPRFSHLIICHVNSGKRYIGTCCQVYHRWADLLPILPFGKQHEFQTLEPG